MSHQSWLLGVIAVPLEKRNLKAAGPTRNAVGLPNRNSRNLLEWGRALWREKAEDELLMEALACKDGLQLASQVVAVVGED